MKLNHLSVHIGGNNEAGKDLVAAIVQKSLSENGFVNVTLVNSVGEPTINTQAVSTIFDAVKAADPALFNEPVRIWTSSPNVDMPEEISIDDLGATNGIPLDVDTQFMNDAIEADAAMSEPEPA
jgi:hypothetical protein